MKKMKCQSQPMIVVNNVPASSKWYQKVLDCTGAHGGDEYEMLTIGERMILQLHTWETEHNGHPGMGKKSITSRGNGVILWFLVDDFDSRVKAIKKLKAKILKDVSVNPNAQHREIWIKDPDGYTVVLAGHYNDL